MYLSWNWLKDFVKIPGSVTPEELAGLFTKHTVEIDGIIKQAEKYSQVVVGKILEIKKHPNADRLQLVKVDVGKEKLDIVCGAHNIEAGQFVPVALVGAVLPNGLEIKQVEVRGEKSNGMLCAPDELGLGKDHGGILILEDAGIKTGKKFVDYLDLNDVVFEVDNKSITHRADLWSHYGMAREISAFLGTKFRPYSKRLNKKILSDRKENAVLEVEIKDLNLCPRYQAVIIEGIAIKPSPRWLEDRLISVGSRPINNIVDITNYVMLELGQPLHAFDRKLVDKIIVRTAHEGEVIETLDGIKRTLDPNRLVIADSKKPIAVAGVMGGAESEISDRTETIILEAANFNFTSIRKTAQKLNLRTEASMRFEKSLDPNLGELALARAIELIEKVNPGARVIAMIDEKKFKLNQGPITLDLNWLYKKLGQKIEEKEVRRILTALGFSIAVSSSQSTGVKKSAEPAKTFSVTIPSWRAGRDVASAEDLMEEVIRIYGYDKLISAMPKTELKPVNPEAELMWERKIKNILSYGAGLTEVYNYSFVGEDQLQKFNQESRSAIRIANPIASHQTLLRPSLAPNLFQNIKANQARREKIALFEVGRIFLDSPGEINKVSSQPDFLPYQEKYLGIVLAGENSLEIFGELKGIIDYLIRALGLEAQFEISAAILDWADEGISADILIHTTKIGSIAGLSGKLARENGIKKESCLAEINLKDLNNLLNKEPVKKFKEFAKFPPLIRDLAFVVSDKIMYNQIREAILGFNGLIARVELFDIYQGEKLGRGKKNLAFHIIYQADRTLTSEEIDKIQASLIKELKNKFAAQVRNF